MIILNQNTNEQIAINDDELKALISPILKEEVKKYFDEIKDAENLNFEVELPLLSVKVLTDSENAVKEIQDVSLVDKQGILKTVYYDERSFSQLTSKTKLKAFLNDVFVGEKYLALGDLYFSNKNGYIENVKLSILQVKES